MCILNNCNNTWFSNAHSRAGRVKGAGRGLGDLMSYL